LRLLNSITPFTLCNKVVKQVLLRSGGGGGGGGGGDYDDDDDDGGGGGGNNEDYFLLKTIFSGRQSRSCEELHLHIGFNSEITQVQCHRIYWRKNANVQ
jgi:hypothetical protein